MSAPQTGLVRLSPFSDPALPSSAALPDGTLVRGGCGGCHAIRGTDAAGGLGPGLTHVGSRRTIGAGILDNTIGNLETWIADSQRIKPDNPMPSFDFIEGEDLHALAAYLKSLQ